MQKDRSGRTDTVPACPAEYGEGAGRYGCGFLKGMLNREGLYRMLSMKGKPLMAHPVPPLNIIVTSDDGRPLSYPNELEKYLIEQGASSMEMHAKKLANMRNTILYASNDGYPMIKDLQNQFFVL